MKLAFITMIKEEKELLRLFARHYTHLTSPDLIYILDNGSESAETREILRDVSGLGINVIYKYSSSDHFDKKGECIKEVINDYGLQNTCDFIFPVDCDELLALKKDDQILLDSNSIWSYMAGLEDRGYGFRVNYCLNNIPLVRDRFNLVQHKKAFFSKKSSIGRLDVGFHLFGEDGRLVPTDLAYVHFHNRYYEQTLCSAREKLKHRATSFEQDYLREYRESPSVKKGRHLVKYFKMGISGYYKTKNLSKNTVTVDFSTHANRINFRQPFVEPFEESGHRIFWLKNPCNHVFIPDKYFGYFDAKPNEKSLLISFGDQADGCIKGNKIYDRANGYGWIENLPAHSRVRAIDDDLLGRFILSFVPLRYKIDLPNGCYRVSVLCFDILFDNHCLAVGDTQGQEITARTDKGRYVRLDLYFRVDNGELVLNLNSPADNLIVNALYVEESPGIYKPGVTYRDIPPVTAMHEWREPIGGGDAGLKISGRYIDPILKDMPRKISAYGEPDYMEIISGIVRYYMKQQDQTGAIIDPNLKREYQYATPAFAFAAATAFISSRESGIFDAAVSALNRSIEALSKREAPDGHEDFFPYLISKTLILIRPLVPVAAFERWLAQLNGLNPYSIYRSPIGGSDKAGQNWNMIASAGEFFLNKIGVRRDSGFIENSLALQGRHFDSEYGVYAEGPVVYDIKPRVFWLDALINGYQGRYAKKLEDVLDKGAMTSALIQSPTGELPPGGRSSHHVWGDALQCALFEMASYRSFLGGDQFRAGLFKGAAHQAFCSIAKHRDEKGDLWVVKNRFDPASRIGFESYTSRSHYNLLAAVMLSLAHEYSRLNPEVRILEPACTTGTALTDLSKTLGRIVAVHKGSQVVIDTGRNLKQNPTGLIRIYVSSGSNVLGLPDGLVKNASFGQKGATICASAGIGWRDGDAGKKYLSGIPRSSIGNIKVSGVNAGPAGLSFDILYDGLEGKNLAVYERYLLTGTRVSVRYEILGEVSDIMVRVPFLVGDGKSDFPASLHNNILVRNTLSVKGRDGKYGIRIVGFKKTEISETVYSHRNGEARIFVGSLAGKGEVGFDFFV